MRRANVISGVVLAVFAMTMLLVVIPWQIEQGPPGMVSPRLVPNMMMIAVTGLALLLVVTNLQPPEGASAGTDAGTDLDPPPVTRRELAALLKIGAVFALALVLYEWVSPLAAGIGLVCGALLALGERRPLVLILMPAVLLLLLWALFYKVLGTAIV